MPQDNNHYNGTQYRGRGYTQSGARYGQKSSEDRFTATFKFTRVSMPPQQNARRHGPTDTRRTVSRGAASRDAIGHKTVLGGNGNAKSRNLLPVPVRGAPTQKRKNLQSRTVSASVKKSSESGVSLIRKRLIASRMPKMHTVNARVIRRFPIRLVMLAVLCTFLFMIIIYNNVQINEKSADIEEIEDQIEEIEEKINQAALNVEKKNDLRVIEQRALELGMVKADQLEKEYVTIASSDKVQLITEEEDEDGQFRMTGIFETVRDKLTEFIESIR